MQLLLENAADASLVDDQGDTPLHCAAGSLDRGLESVRMLMKLGKVDPRVRNNQGYHLINSATTTHFSVQQLLIALFRADSKGCCRVARFE